MKQSKFLVDFGRNDLETKKPLHNWSGFFVKVAER